MKFDDLTWQPSYSYPAEVAKWQSSSGFTVTVIHWGNGKRYEVLAGGLPTAGSFGSRGVEVMLEAIEAFCPSDILLPLADAWEQVGADIPAAFMRDCHAQIAEQFLRWQWAEATKKATKSTGPQYA